jgi:hypothetical protein
MFLLYASFVMFVCLQDLLLRIPMHEIAAMCYIKDDKQHILAVKFGTSLTIELVCFKITTTSKFMF